MSRDSRMALAALDYGRSTEALILALLETVPEDVAMEDDEIQKAMLTYLEGAAKFQADAAMFMAQSKVSNG